MSYTTYNFRTKKALKEAVEFAKASSNNPQVRCYNPGLGLDLSNYTGKVSLEGPHYPAAHTWYGAGEMVNGILMKVK